MKSFFLIPKYISVNGRLSVELNKSHIDEYLKDCEFKNSSNLTSYHVTLITSDELKMLDENTKITLNNQLSTNQEIDLIKVGIGKTKTEFEFIVVISDRLQQIRLSVGLQRKDLHINLGTDHISTELANLDKIYRYDVKMLEEICEFMSGLKFTDLSLNERLVKFTDSSLNERLVKFTDSSLNERLVKFTNLTQSEIENNDYVDFINWFIDIDDNKLFDAKIKLCTNLIESFDFGSSIHKKFTHILNESNHLTGVYFNAKYLYNNSDQNVQDYLIFCKRVEESIIDSKNKRIIDLTLKVLNYPLINNLLNNREHFYSYDKKINKIKLVSTVSQNNTDLR